LTQGPRLFSKHCASCHRFDGHDGAGRPVKEPPTASDLKGFASRAWLTGLLDPEKISTPHYFGATKFKDGKMSKFVKKDIARFSPAEKANLLKVIAAVSAEAQLPAQGASDIRDAASIAEGRALFQGDMRCSECHQFRKQDEDATAPNLTGYGSREWIVGLLTDPGHPSYYGKSNDRMPAFGAKQMLDAPAMTLLADWLRGQWFVPAAGGRH
jgi:ubiquinol-cytochrome c reductase cytochrome b subunit